MATLTNKYVFSGHESFPCKSLWLKKGYDFVVAGKDFNNPDAVIDLGVGKNMVASIRYWLRVFGICDNVYNWFFTDYQKGRKPFTREHLITYVKRRMIGDGKEKQFNLNTVKRDVGVLMQNYCMPRKIQSHEDFSALLLDLHLLLYREDAKEYVFNNEGKTTVIPEIFFYGLMTIKGTDNSIPFDTLQELGLIFCMTDLEMIDMLRLLSERYPDVIHYSDVAGVRQVLITKQVEPRSILDYHYGAV